MLPRRGLLPPLIALPFICRAAAGSRNRVRPGDPGWPTGSDWQALNTATNRGLSSQPQVCVRAGSSPADAGAYLAESSYFQPDWQHAYWGANYPRLQSVKQKYDPDGLFFARHGVGSEAWTQDGFSKP